MVIVCSGLVPYHRMGGLYTIETYFLHSGGWEVQAQSAGIWVSRESQLAGHAVSSGGGRGEGDLWVYLTRALILFVRAPPS